MKSNSGLTLAKILKAKRGFEAEPDDTIKIRGKKFLYITYNKMVRMERFIKKSFKPITKGA